MSNKEIALTALQAFYNQISTFYSEQKLAGTQPMLTPQEFEVQYDAAKTIIDEFFAEEEVTEQSINAPEPTNPLHEHIITFLKEQIYPLAEEQAELMYKGAISHIPTFVQGLFNNKHNYKLKYPEDTITPDDVFAAIENDIRNAKKV